MVSYSNNSEFWFLLMGLGLVLAIITRVFAHKRRSLELKHETYRRLIETGQLDRQALDQIISGIEGRPLPRPALNGRSNFVTRASFVVGWLSIFIGISLLIGSQIQRDSSMCTAGFVIGLIGIGMASMPIAWREIHAGVEAERRA